MIQTSGIFTGGGEGGKYKPYLTFKSAYPFSLARLNLNFDGILEYSKDAESWSAWADSSQVIVSSPKDAGEDSGNHVVYLRGSGNSVMNGTDNALVVRGWCVRCQGNIETLLDYETVAAGEHPAMGEGGFRNLFRSSPGLYTAPDLPATTLTKTCYAGMFQGCKRLITAPELPALAVPGSAYSGMFNGCASLLWLPKMRMTECDTFGCMNMFANCTKIKISETETEDEYIYAYNMPKDDDGTALPGMFVKTGGSFVGTPVGNTTYYVSNTNIVV